MNFVKPTVISLQDHPTLNEKWVQDRIAEDPSILGLGDLVLKDKERKQPRAGRLDLLFQDPDTDRRFEVEVQLGKTDESHIIRTIEYFDIERRRYPQYDHCAVIVAEDVTSRFLNVIGMFNGFIPLIAIQMKAIQIGDTISLMFTTVVDELTLGTDDEEEDAGEATDRAYWEKKTPLLAVVDKVFELVRPFDPTLALRYNRQFIGITRNSRACHFVSFRPRKNLVILRVKLQQSKEIDEKLETTDLDVLEYKARSGQYRIKLTGSDVDQHRDLITELAKLAFKERVEE